MRRRATACLLVLGSLVAGLFLASGRAVSPRRSGWVVLDLAVTPPTVGKRQHRPVLTFLGDSRSWPAAPGVVDDFDPRQRAAAGQIRALVLPRGQWMAWPLQLGRQAFFSFVPIEGSEGAGVRVDVEDSNERRQTLLHLAVGALSGAAPSTVSVDLSRYGGQAARLWIKATGERTGRRTQADYVVIGSPAIVHRAAPPAPRPLRANVILLAFDTLRADAIGPRPDGPSLTPALDRLRAASDRWAHAYSTFNATNPSFASIHTGLYGKHHGVYGLATPLPEERVTLAEVYRAAGYRTAAVISAHHLGPLRSGLGQGFDDVFLAPEQFAAEAAVDTAIEWLQSSQPGPAEPGAGRPFFLWLHLFDAHTPYTPPRPFAEGRRPRTPAGLAPPNDWIPFRPPGLAGFDEPVLGGARELYFGEAAYLDRQVDRLLGFLESHRLLENTWLATVSDHGENLGEHGIRYRHAGLFETTTHVPLWIRRPGAGAATGREFPALAQTLDLFPTLLRATGLTPPPQDGIDLYSETLGRPSSRRYVISEDVEGRGATVRTTDSRLTVLTGSEAAPVPAALGGGIYFFDLEADPQERVNLAGKGGVREASLRRLLEGWLAAAKRPQSGPALTPEEIARLRALGYL